MKNESETFKTQGPSMLLPLRTLRAGPGGRDRHEQANVMN
jgi:hypothetical protein